MPRLLSLTVLLALSLVAHGGWATPPSSPKDTPAPAPGGAGSGVLTAPFAERLAAARTAADFRSVMAELRGAGVPESQVRPLVLAAVEDNVLRHRQADFDHAVGPYWRDVDLAPGPDEAMRDILSLLAELGSLSSPLEQARRRRQYGGLPEAKAAALEKLLHDHAARRRELYSTPVDHWEGDEVARQDKLLREEQQRTLNTLLTPEERLEWDLRHSRTAEILRRHVRDIDLTEAEFRALFAPQRKLEEEFRALGYGWRVYKDAPPPRGVMLWGMGWSQSSLAQLERVLAAWEAQQVEIRRVLGDDRYRTVALAAARLSWKSATHILKTRPELTVDQLTAILRMEWSLPIDVQRAEGASGLSLEERRTRKAAVEDRYRDELAKLLGAATAKEIFLAVSEAYFFSHRL